MKTLLIAGTSVNAELVAIFTETGFALDTEATTAKQFYADDRLLSESKADPYKALLYFGFAEKAPAMSQSLLFLHGIASFFVDKLSKNPDIEITRTSAPLTDEESQSLLLKTPYAIGSEFVDAVWLANLWGNLARTFETEIAKFDGTAAQFLLTHSSNINVAGRVFFHLVENKSDDYPFAFLATYSRATQTADKAEHVPLRNALTEYEGNQELLLQLLSTVSRAADASDFISELVESGELFSPLRFTSGDAYTFLKEISVYERCGIMCRIPDWWKKKHNQIRVSVSIGGTQPPRLGLDALLSYTPSLVVDGVEITRAELEELLSQTEGLALLKGKWVEIDHEKLAAVLAAFDKAAAQSGGMTLSDAMRMQMGIATAMGTPEDDIAEITNGQWLSGVMGALKTHGNLGRVAVGEDFKAKLREYQQQGLDWLAAMKSMGFGALLADDMGLGKTVQVLALLEHLRRGKGKAETETKTKTKTKAETETKTEASTSTETKTLLIVPASLIGNWEGEIGRFAPMLSYRVLHGKDRDLGAVGGLFITTYGMASRLEALKEQRWDTVIIDEAQAIKNPAAKQTKAVKAIPAKHRIAMTGTPVENRLSDLWSIFDFLNCGLLGTSKEFSDYAGRIQGSESYAKLRGVISPFILRRQKTDKSIIADLPDKVEMKVRSSLTKKQVVLYTALVREMQERLETLDGIARKGAVLACIMKFKQICNHPDQYLGQGVFDPAHSGKFAVLGEICETIRAGRERVLVFTQFREMCDPLSEFLEAQFGRKGLILHGGTPVKKRAGLVETFNDPGEYTPYMVLSLKAGGVGLNLTAANHVVHFDRWWNPAVENQATDRAFRIGQKKNVLVHKFIASGTIEEKIDSIIEDKTKLSSELIAASGENWITEMGSDELMKLMKLDM
jgi:non-specific serine/threonine protein kinase